MDRFLILWLKYWCKNNIGANDNYNGTKTALICFSLTLHMHSTQTEWEAGWQTTFSPILALAFWAQGSCREKQWPFWRSSSGAVGGRAFREAQQAGSSRQESWNKQKGLLSAEKRLRSRARYTGVSIGAWKEALNYIMKLLTLASEEVKIE